MVYHLENIIKNIHRKLGQLFIKHTTLYKYFTPVFLLSFFEAYYYVDEYSNINPIF